MQLPPTTLAFGLAVALGGCSLVFDDGSNPGTGPTPEDAGVDASPCLGIVPTIASFEKPTLQCGETEFAVPVIDVQSGSAECPVSGVRWTLDIHGSTGSVVSLFSYGGALDQRMPQEARVLGGTFGNPRFNIASYHGPKILRVEVSDQVGGTDQVYQAIGALALEDHTLRVNMASFEGKGVRVRLFPHATPFAPDLGPEDQCLGPSDPACASAQSLTFIAKDFKPVQPEEDARLQFALPGNGTYYFDRATVIRATDGSQLVADSTFEGPVGSAGWQVSCASKCNSDFIDIPDVLQEFGNYRLGLTALGPAGTESETMSHTILHEACPI